MGETDPLMEVQLVVIQDTFASGVHEKRMWRWLIPPDDPIEIPNNYAGVEFMDPDASLPPRYIAVASASAGTDMGWPVIFMEFWTIDREREMRRYRSIWAAESSGRERPEVIAEAKNRLGIKAEEEPLAPTRADLLDQVKRFFEDSEAATEPEELK
jgi:hypothetical protein